MTTCTFCKSDNTKLMSEDKDGGTYRWIECHACGRTGSSFEPAARAQCDEDAHGGYLTLSCQDEPTLREGGPGGDLVFQVGAGSAGMPDGDLIIKNGSGLELVRIKPNGLVLLNSQKPVDEIAAAFWKAVALAHPAKTIASLETQVQDLTEQLAHAHDAIGRYAKRAGNAEDRLQQGKHHHYLCRCLECEQTRANAERLTIDRCHINQRVLNVNTNECATVFDVRQNWVALLLDNGKNYCVPEDETHSWIIVKDIP
jgi:hypothetical protein